MNIKSIDYKQLLIDAFIAVCAALLLCVFAFYNGYPLVYSDTGSYIHYGFEKEVPFDRPILYCIFLRLFSLKFSLWIPVFLQALMTVWSIRYLINAFSYSVKQKRLLLVVVIFILTATTGISQKCSNLLPDFTTALLPILLAGWIAGNRRSGAENAAAIGILLFSLLSHGSNLYIFLLIVMAISILYLLRIPALRKAGKKFLLVIWMLVGCGFGGMLLINFLFSGEFFLNRNGSVFITGHLAHSGLLDEFLIEKCENKNYVLCEWKGACANVDFLWDENSSPHYKTGGWHNNAGRYDEMLHDFFTTPAYLWKYFVSTGKLGTLQLFDSGLHAEIENIPMKNGSAPYGQIEWRFPKELPAYTNARQFNDQLDYSVINSLQTVAVSLSLIVIFAGLVILRNRSSEHSKLVLLTITFTAAVVVNSFVCAGLTISNSRFGSRMIWLIVLAGLLYAAEYIRFRLRVKSE